MLGDAWSRPQEIDLITYTSWNDADGQTPDEQRDGSSPPAHLLRRCRRKQGLVVGCTDGPRCHWPFPPRTHLAVFGVSFHPPDPEALARGAFVMGQVFWSGSRAYR